MANMPYNIVSKDGTVVMKGVTNVRGETDMDSSQFTDGMELRPQLY